MVRTGPGAPRRAEMCAPCLFLAKPRILCPRCITYVESLPSATRIAGSEYRVHMNAGQRHPPSLDGGGEPLFRQQVSTRCVGRTSTGGRAPAAAR